MLVRVRRLRPTPDGVRRDNDSRGLVLASPNLRREGETSAQPTSRTSTVIGGLPPGGNYCRSRRESPRCRGCLAEGRGLGARESRPACRFPAGAQRRWATRGIDPRGGSPAQAATGFRRWLLLFRRRAAPVGPCGRGDPSAGRGCPALQWPCHDASLPIDCLSKCRSRFGCNSPSGGSATRARERAIALPVVASVPSRWPIRRRESRPTASQCRGRCAISDTDSE